MLQFIFFNNFTF